jgi:hypothetical protein
MLIYKCCLSLLFTYRMKQSTQIRHDRMKMPYFVQHQQTPQVFGIFPLQLMMLNQLHLNHLKYQ